MTAELRDPYEIRREMMVTLQLMQRGITDRRVLEAMKKVPRHLFVPEELRKEAYDDKPLPLGPDQTISQPFIVALMLERLKLKGRERILEVGTGSGYQTALLAELGSQVFSIELDPTLATSAEKMMLELGYGNVAIRTGDGHQGWAEHAPFDVIIVSAAPALIPRPLVGQLGEGARMLLPLGEERQYLVYLEKTSAGLQSREMESVRFVPLKEGH